MMSFEYDGINSFMVGMSQILIDNGIKRNTRGKVTWELPEPLIVKITNPRSRLITIPCRKWNIFLSYAESLWIASGRNDLEFIQHYLNNMSSFSDDGKYVRGGYGPRFRKFNGSNSDYKKSAPYNDINKSKNEIDQYSYVINSFKRDPWTRQGIITIGDPLKDCFDNNGMIKQTKDFPCTRLLQFMRKPDSNKLDLTVYMRSNDFFWGATGVNIFNYTFIQEYFSAILGLEVGDYYHIINNLHYYSEFRSNLEQLANISGVTDPFFDYKYRCDSLFDFNAQLLKLSTWEEKVRKNEIVSLEKFDNDFFDDWAKVLFYKNKKVPVNFSNPILNEIINM